MIQSREQAAVALFALLTKTTGIVNAYRYVRDTTTLTTGNMPTLELIAKREVPESAGEGMPTKWTVKYMAVICVSTVNGDVLGDTLLNNFLDAIEAAIKPPPGQRQTLSGAVYDCRMNRDEILRDPGTLSGIGAAAIPIEVITTS